MSKGEDIGIVELNMLGDELEAFSILQKIACSVLPDDSYWISPRTVKGGRQDVLIG